MQAENNQQQQIVNGSAQNLHSEEPAERVLTCKICLTEESEEQRVKKDLISPCSCTGSMQYVHKKCICTWLELKWKENG